MAKKKKSVKQKSISKTQLIKDAMAKNPAASPAEIAAQLKSHKISAGYVSAIKSSMKAKRKKKAGRPAGKTTAKRAPSDNVSVASLMKAKKLADELGGVAKAKSLLDALSKLTN